MDKRQGFPPLYKAHHDRYFEDIPFWEKIIQQHPGPILELGCGTGRVAQRLAREGQILVCLDIDFHMLRFFYNISQFNTPGGPMLFQADMSAFHLSNKFTNIILPCNTLSTLSRNQRVKTFQCAFNHLRTGGIFCASLPNPDFLKTLPTHSPIEYEESFWHPDDNEPVQVSSGWSRSRVSMSITWLYDHLMPDGKVDRLTVKTTHSLDRFDVYAQALTITGFQKVDCFGDFDFSPYSSNSEFLILLAQK